MPDSVDPPIAVTGSGSYTSGEFGPSPEASLFMPVDLRVGDAPSRRFTGGPDKIAKLNGIRSPDIRVALTLSNKSCQDTVIVVDASPLGACCPKGPDDPSCLITTETECESQGGTYQGMGSTCPTDPGVACGVAEGVGFDCPVEPWQPCCVPDPAPSEAACFRSTQEACGAAGGTYLGGGACKPVLCDATPFACCRSGFPCTDGVLDACAGSNSIVLEPGSTCEIVDCEDVTAGACCAANPAAEPSCFVATPEACSFAGGAYHGDGTTCPSDPEELCGPYTGACCFANEDATESTCTVTTFEACLAEGGIHQGDHTTCDPALCKCCFPYRSCTTMPPGVCTDTLDGLPTIPAASAWGVVAMAVLLLAAGMAVTARRIQQPSTGG